MTKLENDSDTCAWSTLRSRSRGSCKEIRGRSERENGRIKGHHDEWMRMLRGECLLRTVGCRRLIRKGEEGGRRRREEKEGGGRRKEEGGREVEERRGDMLLGLLRNELHVKRGAGRKRSVSDGVVLSISKRLLRSITNDQISRVVLGIDTSLPRFVDTPHFHIRY